MNVYDFDHTIYDGDSSLDFYIYMLLQKPSIIKFLPQQIFGCFKYLLGKTDTKQFKECFFVFLCETDNIDGRIKDFWDKNEKKIKKWYKKEDNDVIISASPEFLLSEICNRVGIKSLIATKMDARTGKITGKNCKGIEKVIRFQEIYPSENIDNFYTDSKSDYPLAKIASQAFWVCKKVICGDVIKEMNFK